MKELRVVIDTNIIVSILKSSSKISSIYTAFKENKFKLVISSELLKELAAVLYRPKLKIDSSDIKELFRLIKSRAIRAKLPPPYRNACRDSKDNFLLELAIESDADFIVTGDEDLLVLNPFRDISIVSPKEFICWLNK